MERERRYTVIKEKDLAECFMQGVISPEEINALGAVLEKLHKYRLDRGKKRLECVVVESDWPEYEPVWNMLETRIQREIESAILEQRFGPDSIPTGLPYFYVVDGKSLVCSNAHSPTRLLRYSGYKYKILYSTEPFDPAAVFTTSWAGSPKKAEMITRDVIMTMEPEQIIAESNARQVK